MLWPTLCTHERKFPQESHQKPHAEDSWFFSVDFHDKENRQIIRKTYHRPWQETCGTVVLAFRVWLGQPFLLKHPETEMEFCLEYLKQLCETSVSLREFWWSLHLSSLECQQPAWYPASKTVRPSLCFQGVYPFDSKIWPCFWFENSEPENLAVWSNWRPTVTWHTWEDYKWQYDSFRLNDVPEDSCENIPHAHGGFMGHPRSGKRWIALLGLTHDHVVSGPGNQH